VRALLLFLFTVLFSAFFSGLWPDGVAPPDLGFLFVVALTARLSPVPALFAAFFTGLFFDLAAAGYPGLHAVGYLLAAFAQQRLGALLHWEEALGRAAIVVGAYLAKWLGVFLVVYWLGLFGVGPLAFAGVFLGEAAGTLILAPLYLWLAEALLGEEGHGSTA